MSLDKAIEHGKEHRKQYYDCRSFDRGCRCHGGCDWCQRRRRSRKVRQMPVDDNGHTIGRIPPKY